MRLVEIFRSIVSKEWAAKLAVGGVIASTFVLAAFLIAPKANADTAQPGDHLLSIHESGTTRGFMTHATTLRAALAEAHVVTTDQDLVEPALDTQLVASNYDVNIYRALPVTVIDGTTQIRTMSPYRAARQIVEHAGLLLHPEDTVTIATAQNVATSGPALTLTIHRATPFTLILYGKPVPSYTQAKTVGEMLRGKGIKLASNDTVSVAQSAPIAAGMTVEVWREGVQTVTVEQPVPFSTQQIQNADQPAGYKQVQTPGQNGSEMVTYQITVKNGVEISRQAIQTVVTQQPVQQVEVVGTKVSLPPGSHTDWMAAAGMDPNNYGYINYIFTGESHWNPAAVNPYGYSGLGQTSQSRLIGACGATWASDPVCQIGVFNSYAISRYGSWAGAAAHWRSAQSW